MAAAPIEDDSVADICIEVEQDMLATTPTTVAGLLALVEYADQRQHGDDMIPVEYFPAILAACRAVLPGGGS